MLWMGLGLGMLAAPAALALVFLRRWHMSRWVVPYLRTWRRRRAVQAGEEIHLLLCIADHFEPKANEADLETGRRRVERWLHDYPRQFARFRDRDNRPPRYSFFFPAEEYESTYLDALGQLCRAGFGEVEIHLHHHDDTAASFRAKLLAFRDQLHHRHGLLSHDRHSGAPAYGFIHGNWALCNSRPDGAWCGVNNELAILKETGCYGDFTFPSAPDPTQPPILNTLYFAADCPGQSRSHEIERPLGAEPPADALLMVQGPLLIDWGQRKWGFLPGLENACLQATQPPTPARLDAWLQARVQAPGRADWFFVKLHAHGAPEDAHEVLLGEPMVRFHEELARRMANDPHFHVHYVTAREMANLALAAAEGFKGPVNEARDYRWVSNTVGP